MNNNIFTLPSELMVNNMVNVVKVRPTEIPVLNIYTDGSCYWLAAGKPCVYLARGGVYLLALTFNGFHKTLSVVVGDRSWQPEGSELKGKLVTIQLDEEFIDEAQNRVAPEIYTELIEEILCDKLNIEHASVMNTIDIAEFEEAIKNCQSFRLGNDMHTILA